MNVAEDMIIDLYFKCSKIDSIVDIVSSWTPMEKNETKTARRKMVKWLVEQTIIDYCKNQRQQKNG